MANISLVSLGMLQNKALGIVDEKLRGIFRSRSDIPGVLAAMPLSSSRMSSISPRPLKLSSRIPLSSKLPAVLRPQNTSTSEGFCLSPKQASFVDNPPLNRESSWKLRAHPILAPVLQGLSLLLAWAVEEEEEGEEGTQKAQERERREKRTRGNSTDASNQSAQSSLTPPESVAPEKISSDAWSTAHRPDWACRRAVSLYSIAALLSCSAAFSPFLEASLADTLPAITEPSSSISYTEGPTEEASRELRYKADTTVTQKVFLDFSLCPTAVRLDRTLGDRSLICSDGEPLGRVVLGLYGNQVPVTVQHFVDMVTGKAGSSYKGTIIHRSLPGQYIMGGHQGSVDKGEVKPPSDLGLNPETVQQSAFLLSHLRPGTVSLALSENDDESSLRSSPDYRNVEFLITTGPGPATQLDSQNVVFGAVVEGMEVVREIATVPTYKPDERIRQFNDLAVLLGDERAAKGRSRWNQPLKAIVISDCGVVDLTPQLLPPSLP